MGDNWTFNELFNKCKPKKTPNPKKLNKTLETKIYYILSKEQWKIPLLTYIWPQKADKMNTEIQK